MALRHWESSTWIAAFLPERESAATKPLALTELYTPFDWPPQCCSELTEAADAESDVSNSQGNSSCSKGEYDDGESS